MSLLSKRSSKNKSEEPLTEKKDRLSKLILSSDQIAQLISLVAVERVENSPIPESLAPLPVDKIFQNMLTKNGWATLDNEDGETHLVDKAKLAVSSLLTPKTHVQIVLGSPKEMAITQLFSAEKYTDEALIIYTHREADGVHVIDPGHSPSDISDALLVQLLNGPHLEGLNFELELKEDILLCYLAVLDLIYSRQLKAKLEALSFPALNFDAGDVWNRFSEIRLGEDLLWSSVLIPYLFPYLNPKLTEKGIKSALQKLTEDNLLTPVSKKTFQPTDFTLSLAEGLLPIISFGSCAVITGNDKGLNIGFVIGLNINLVVNVISADEEQVIKLTGMDGVQLSRLLFEIGLPAEINDEDKEL